MFYNCPHCKDRGSIAHKYPEGPNRSENHTVTVHETCQCQAHLPSDREYWLAQGACDCMARAEDHEGLAKYIETLHPLIKDKMSRIYSVNKYLDQKEGRK